MAGLTATQNYLVPASGSTHGYPVSQAFSATPFAIDFRNVELDGQPFVPSGVFVDNSAGIGDLEITVAGFNYSVVCPAGGRLQAQYPAPVDQSCTITGNGQASVVFVDFPVIPFLQETAATLGNVAIVNGGDVAQGDTGDAIATAPFSAAYTMIALTKALATYAQTQENSIGLNGDPVATAPFGNPWAAISLLKAIATQAANLNTAEGTIADAIAVAPFTNQSAISLLKYLAQSVNADNRYPLGAVPFNVQVTTANAASTATVAAVAGKTHYITKLTFGALSATAAVNVFPNTTGTLGGPCQYYGSLPAGIGAGSIQREIDFDPPLPASAVNTAVAFTMSAVGAGSAAQSVGIQGFTK